MNKSNMKRNAQAGFTLIELIVVIVILGILAATALPKFSSLGGDARLASLQAAKGALSSTVAMAKGKYLVNGTGTPLTTLTVEGVTAQYTTLADGYLRATAPTAALAGLAADYHVVAAAGTLSIYPMSLRSQAATTRCVLRYTPSTVKGVAPAFTLTATAADCE
ncbi:type II secretion system protein [Massilia sp. RP-1-19]|uniref:Type II secretion system protein n=1 Tax=Massilia polaris TaxID=2728846 RepID=A0A848HKY9_9BURK|nr:type II secretion system protein [Massilia polaris]NML60850.1 type II secretion system protein [Massilia polaris]